MQSVPQRKARGPAFLRAGFRRARPVLLPLGFVFALVLAVVIGANVWVWAAAREAVFDDLARVPVEEVGLVLGTIPLTADGRPHPLFEKRMDAAAALYRAGKVGTLLVSGGNLRTGYDGSADMRDALLARGVPAGAITCDSAGYRTLDSLVRARTVFGVRRMIIVSQADHARRAVFIAQRLGIPATGFAADGLTGLPRWRAAVRELGARVRAVLDLYVLNLPTDMQPAGSVRHPVELSRKAG